MKSLAIIPARGGSKRIPRKNIRHFNGKPIIGHVIEKAIESKIFSKVIVSTDSTEVSDISMSFGAEVPFVRPKEISDDVTSVIEVIRHGIKYFENINETYENICLLYPTAPLLDVEDLIKGLALLQTSDFAVSVSEFPFPIERALVFNSEDKIIEMKDKQHFYTRSQDFPATYHDAGQFIFGNKKAWMQKIPLIDGKNSPVFIARERVQDIDNELDWDYAEKKGIILASES